MKKEQERNMIELFKGYTNYSDDEYKRIWESAVIVVDTNILLNFYRYSKDTRNEMFKILTNLKNRLWLPYQIAKEYFENKNNVMINSYDEYTKLSNNLRDLFESSMSEIKTRKNNQLKCKTEILEILEKDNKKIQDLLLNEKEGKKPTFEKNEVEDKIIELFNDSIADDFLEEEYTDLKKEGQRRIETKTPPGYKDAQKEENGDYYIFAAMIKKSKQINKDFIFITDDVKEDWFNKVNGEKHGGRYELLNEFYNETGHLLMIYTSDGFAKAYNKNIVKKEANEKFVKELINVGQESYDYENFIDNDELKSLLIQKLNDYKVHFTYNGQDFNNQKILKDLTDFVTNMNVSNVDKKRFINLINENRKKLLDGNCYTNEKFLLLIDEFIKYHNAKKPNSAYEEIKYNYVKEIFNLLLSKTSKQILESYNKLILILNKHKRYLKRYSETTNYEVSMQIKVILFFVEQLLLNEDTSLTNKSKLIDKLNSLLKLMNDNYEVLNSYI